MKHIALEELSELFEDSEYTKTDVAGVSIFVIKEAHSPHKRVLDIGGIILLDLHYQHTGEEISQ